jgi:hypothetical protein
MLVSLWACWIVKVMLVSVVELNVVMVLNGSGDTG